MYQLSASVANELLRPIFPQTYKLCLIQYTELGIYLVHLVHGFFTITMHGASSSRRARSRSRTPVSSLAEKLSQVALQTSPEEEKILFKFTCGTDSIMDDDTQLPIAPFIDQVDQADNADDYWYKVYWEYEPDLNEWTQWSWLDHRWWIRSYNNKKETFNPWFTEWINFDETGNKIKSSWYSWTEWHKI